MWTNAMKTVAAATLVLGLAVARPAEADRGGGIAAGVAVWTLLGLGIAGAYAGPRYYDPYYPAAPACYRGPRRCDWVGGSCWYTRFGEYVCSGGGYRCWHPTYCN
jgi:hypothetical protein